MKNYNQHASGDANSLDEIIFAGRNQEYGAFMLRHNSNKRVIQSFFITFIIVAPLFLFGSFNKKEITRNPVEIILDTHFENVNKDAITPPPPPPLPKDLQNILKQSTSGVPLVVDSITEYMENNFVTDPLPVNTASTTGIAYTDSSDFDPVIVIVKGPYIKVEEDATFKGGTITDFCMWVGQHLSYPENAVQMNIQGKVVVQFVVNTKGKTEDIRILKGIDELLDNEAIRVVASSPKWRPARQQGNDVRQLFTIPITFKLDKM